MFQAVSAQPTCLIAQISSLVVRSQLEPVEDLEDSTQAKGPMAATYPCPAGKNEKLINLDPTNI